MEYHVYFNLYENYYHSQIQIKTSHRHVSQYKLVGGLINKSILNYKMYKEKVFKREIVYLEMKIYEESSRMKWELW